ncbi:MAG: hypothetical protein SynsKO_44380 [Synoicihabitans sp.]
MATREPIDWWNRNWKWFVSALVLIALALLAACLATIVLFLKSSQAYELAVREAQENPRVISALGSPVKVRWFVSGKLSFKGSRGKTQLAVPLRGPKGEATLFLQAELSAGNWRFDRLEVRFEEYTPSIDLLDDSASLEGIMEGE